MYLSLDVVKLWNAFALKRAELFSIKEGGRRLRFGAAQRARVSCEILGMLTSEAKVGS
jgi:hypothetical protein